MKLLMKFQVLLKKSIQKSYLNKFFVNKSKIRKKILTLRKKKYSSNYKINFQSIIKILRKKKIQNKVIGGYYAYNYEIDIMPILEKLEKLNYTLSLPKISKNFEMNFLTWSTKSPLSINKYGIPEPISNKIKYPDILLVPLLAYDKRLNRIGYGGGFYDRYIKRIKKIKKIITIGLAYPFQKIKKVPIDEHDINLDIIITGKKIK